MIPKLQVARTYSWRVLAVLLLCLLPIVSTAETQLKALRRVLIINDLGIVSSPGFAEIDQAIFSTLQNSPYQIELYQESLQLTFFPDEASQQAFRESLVRKYSERKPDLIVAAGAASLKFLAESQEKFIQATPIIFCAVLGDIPVQLQSRFHATGVLGRVQPEETLKAALHLLPGTKHVVVVGGMGKFDEEWERIAKQAFQSYESKLDFTYLTDLTMPMLLERISQLPKDTIVYHTSIAQDAAGERFIGSAQSVPLVAGASNAPVFVMDDVDLRAGTVGGDLVNWGEDGRIAGGMAVQVLNGKRPEDIPIVSSKNVYMFDWRALKRWGLNERNLPPGSAVLNREPTFWDLYKGYIITTFVLVLVETLLIAALIWQRARRKKAENELVITYDRLRMAVEAGRFVGWDLDIKAGTNHWFGNLEGMFGITSTDHFAQKDEFRNRVHPDDRDAVVQAIENAKLNRGPYSAEFRIPREGNSVRWVAARGQFYYSSNGDAERMLGLALDITDRKLAEETIRSVSGRLIQAQEQERVRIARELHDDINQRLALLQVDLNRLQQHLPGGDAGLDREFEDLKRRLSDTTIEVHAISHRLHSSKLEYLGLAVACKAFCKEIAERHKLEVEFNADGVPPVLAQDISLTLFRVLQESLQNAIKHSGAERLDVKLQGTSVEVRLTVRDDGVGFEIPAAMSSDGLGLVSMRERVSSVKGTISITSRPKGGTEIDVRIPIMESTRAKVTSGAA